jgi:hypothetical protein
MRDELGFVLCHHGRPIQCLECGDEYESELKPATNGSGLQAHAAAPLQLLNDHCKEKESTGLGHSTSGWRDITEAPHGRSLIGYCVKLPERWVRVGLGAKLANGEWLWHQDVEWGPATHWMPLHAPPVSEGDPTP